MKYEQINSQLFIENRERFKKILKPNSIAIFTSNYEKRLFSIVYDIYHKT